MESSDVRMLQLNFWIIRTNIQVHMLLPRYYAGNEMEAKAGRPDEGKLDD